MRYRLKEGMAAWIIHRVTGVGIVVFLLLHIFDIALVGWGPGLFNSLLFVYRALPFRILEVFLLAGVLFHAINGVRIILIDFWRPHVRFERGFFYGELVLFTLLFVPAVYLMFR